MDANLKRKWIEALRSGRFEQARHVLKDGDALCCIGVLCAIQNADFTRPEMGAPEYDLGPSIPEIYRGGLRLETLGTLAELNDGGGDTPSHSFPEIADWIEKNIPGDTPHA